MKNRYGYTIRLNQSEQKQMQLMMDFYNKDPKEITKLALHLMFIGVGEASKRAIQQQETESKENEPLDTTSQDSQESPQQ